MSRSQSCGVATFALIATLAASPAVATPYGPAPSAIIVDGSTIRGCVVAAAAAHRLPPLVLVILLHVEGGMPGHVTMNSNDTVDIGPMQVNQAWLPPLANHWHASTTDTFLALRDNFCANLDGGAWILRSALDEAHGDFWNGIAIYHSHTPKYKTEYLRKVLAAALHLQTQAQAALAALPLQIADSSTPVSGGRP